MGEVRRLLGHALRYWHEHHPWSDESFPKAECRCGWEWEDTFADREDARAAYRRHLNEAAQEAADE